MFRDGARELAFEFDFDELPELLLLLWQSSSSDVSHESLTSSSTASLLCFDVKRSSSENGIKEVPDDYFADFQLTRSFASR